MTIMERWPVIQGMEHSRDMVERQRRLVESLAQVLICNKRVRCKVTILTMIIGREKDWKKRILYQ